MDMKKLLAATAVAALVAGSNLAAAQGTTAGSPTGVSKSGPAPSAASPASGARDDAGTPGMGDKPAPQRTGQSDIKKGAAPKGDQSPANPSHAGDTKPDTPDVPKSTQRSDPGAAGDAKKGRRAGSSTGTDEKATSGVGSSVTLTAEKRTRIKETIVKSGKAPRVSNVNFSISVGTTVPRSVTLVAVPSTVIEIYPAWRGYEYFIVGDEIVIVDPNTMQIVAVLPA